MENLKQGTLGFKAIFAVFALSFGAVACGGDDSDNKDSGTVITLPDGGTKPLDAGTLLDSGIVAADGGSDAGPIKVQPSSCVVKPNCTCTPTTSVEFLNSCTDTPCYPFDNAARIPGFTGTLPPLQ